MNGELIVVLLMLGLIVGVLAGLLGIGGGLVVVPALHFLLPYIGVSTDVGMRIALATSLACIIVTTSSSVFNNLRLKNIDFYAARTLVPGVVVGGIFGVSLATWIPTEYLPKVFGIIVLGMAIQMFRSVNSQATRPLPSALKTAFSGVGIGTIASLAGVGGGSLTVPFLNRHGIEMRKAVGTSSVCAFAIAVSGMLSFTLHGYHATGLPKWSFGYVYLPALLSITITSVFTTKIGVRLAVGLPTKTLKKIFAIFLMIVAGTMLL
ncbi:sulfite exporter TauE/SafE family protein [Vibrio marisflavi]|uniref:Probable membrane transporter protein n=1 Tax=Vibrio marisflavi CECT 7928 TaxID=634439 RepID=A0ABN8E670_9VIBR|nr:sulfite exporter TauE/SafE family protein [Vibrio marisflavi]CAH0541141.1 hypothetical protein VMF7928_03402 [Vibrio marisflavi CECT 7928]